MLGTVSEPLPGTLSTPMIGRTDNPETPAITPAAQLKALQGLWRVVQCKGPKDTSRRWPACVMPTKTDRVCFRPGFVEFACSQNGSSEMKDYSVDPTATPKTLDLMDQTRYDYDQSGRLLNAPSPERDRLISHLASMNLKEAG